MNVLDITNMNLHIIKEINSMNKINFKLAICITTHMYITTIFYIAN